MSNTNESGSAGVMGSVTHIINEWNGIISSKFGDNAVIVFYISFFVLLCMITSLLIYACYQCKSKAKYKKIGYSNIYTGDDDTRAFIVK